jgi:membrane-bound metal-dependent hydrolase YbcI (DUF457 family)
MFLFGHAGLTLGAAALTAHFIKRPGEETSTKAPWFARLSHHIDVRLLMVGALLSDIIDKPLGIFVFGSTFHNGRIYAHTLLFLLVMAAAGYYLLKKRRQTWLITLAAGTFTHLICDEMWQATVTLFWPLLGFKFPAYDMAGWFGNMFQALISKPYVYVSEAIGLGIVIWYAAWLISEHKVSAFLRRGKIT